MSEDMMPQRSDLVGKYDSYISENKKLRAEIENLRDRLYLASIKVADARVEANKLRARVEELTDALIDARHNGLIYWNPMTERGAVERAAMMARIDKVLNKEAKP